MINSKGEIVQSAAQKKSETEALTDAELEAISAGNIFGDLARFIVRKIREI